MNNMNSVNLSDQLCHVCQVDHWMFKYKWWWYLLFWGHGLILVNAYIIYKTLCEEENVNLMSNYEFWPLVFLVNIDHRNCGARDNMISAVQLIGIRKKEGYTPTTDV